MKRVIVTILLSLCANAMAVGTSHWKQTSAADFQNGELTNIVATNFGDLKLSRHLTALLEQDAHLSAVYCMVEAPDGTIYAGTGPEGVLLAVKNQKVTKVLTLKGEQNIFSLLLDDKGRLLIGTGGERGRILRFDPAAADKNPVELFSSDKARYIWAMTRAADGTTYAATGPNGHLFAIDPAGKSTVLFSSKQSNLLSMVSDGKETLYIGTDPDGLVYRVNRRTGESFILLDAAETEVSALTLDARGNLYAATGQASERQANTPAENAGEQNGRPEHPTRTVVPPVPPVDPIDPSDEPATKAATQTVAEPKTLSLLLDDTDAAQTPGEPATHEGPSGPANAPPSSARKPNVAPAPDGNTIYRIDPQGFVTDLFHTPEMILCLLERDGTLLAGTGGEGKIYEVNPAAEETAVVAKVDPHEVLCLLRARDGGIYLGLANFGGISVMSKGYATRGTYTSEVLDAGQISAFGTLQIRATMPETTGVKISTRSSNVQDPTADGWSAWTAEADAARFQPIKSPAARFLQYRLTLTSAKGDATAVVDEVDVAYQVPNIAPRVTAIAITPAESDAAAEKDLPHGTHIQTIAWTADDANQDALEFDLYFRTVPGGEWIRLKEKLTASQFAWDTRAAADGRYEIKVEASDAAANAAGTGKTAGRVSDPVIVDNTPPEILNLVWLKQPGGARITFAASDQTSTIAAIAYAVDSARDWQAVLPSDSICDELQEPVSFVIGGLTPGKHQVSVRVTDVSGNRSYENVTIDVPANAPAK